MVERPLVLDLGAMIENVEPAPDLAWARALALDPSFYKEIVFFRRGRMRRALPPEKFVERASEQEFDCLRDWLLGVTTSPKMIDRAAQPSWSAPRLSPRAAVEKESVILLKPGALGWDDPGFAAWLMGDPGREAFCLIGAPLALDWPEYASEGEAAALPRRLRAIARLARACIVPDETSKRRLETAFGELSLAAPPAFVVAAPSPLAGGDDIPFDEKFAAIPFFIAIDAIEARANTTMLLHIWRDFLAAGTGAPKLILAGRRGLQIEEIKPLLDWNAKIGSVVYEAPDLAPRHLRFLARHARAVLAADFAGASGPLLRDARALGAKVIASDAPAHREALGDGDLFPPIDGRGWRDAIRAAGAAGPAPQPSARLIEAKDVLAGIRALAERLR